VLRDWQPQVIHIHNIYHQLSFSLLSVARKTGIPVVMTVHDYAAISPDKDAYYPEVGKSYWKFMRIQKYSFSKRLLLTLRAYWEEFLGGYNAFVDIFIVPSKLVEQALVATGIPQSKIVLLPHFTTVAKNRSTKEELPTNLPEKFILALTGASAVKNTPWLEETCITLGIPLVIAGTVEDSYQPSTSPCIFYVGQKSQEELNNYWQRAVAGVSASLLPETFGLVALEALSLGKSFFCFDAGAYKEVVRTGVDGVVAQSEEEFTAGLQKMWNQETVYDLVAIQKSAEERFGAAGYLEKFLKILKTLPHK
jgi:glycosyltransferase involved in cell wall biosynthesis